jgi:hypothetical protein
MFELNPNEEQRRTFIREIHVQQPKDSAFRSFSFRAEFLDIRQAEIDAIIEDSDYADRDLLRKVLVGWQDIVGPDKQPVPFSEEVREQLIERPWVRTPMVRVYFEVINGGRVKDRKRKNS